MNHKKIIYLSLILAFFIFIPKITKASGNFNPNHIISDAEILDYSSMSLETIDKFLDSKAGYLANYSCANPDGKVMTAAEIIYDRATTNKISPKFLLVLLQKEQSLVEDKSPTQSQLDWAAGYGCPDGSGCNVRWKGFWKQMNSASLQFRDYIDNPHLYTYKTNNTYTFTNPYATIASGVDIVTPANNATAALYNYTPHVYNGNFNFYNIWQRYFTRSYYDGALLQAQGEVGVWLIQNGKKRPFLTKSALTSRFDENKILIVTKSDLDKYEKGTPIKFPNYSLVRSPRGTIYLLVDSKKRGFDSSEAFKQIGYNPEEVMDAGWEDINSYEEGKPLTSTSTYPTGALLQNKATGGVYYVSEGEKSPVWDSVFLRTKFKDKKMFPVSASELDSYQTIKPVMFNDGELVRTTNHPAVYLIVGNEKKPFLSGKTFESLGYKWENVIAASSKMLSLYNIGEPMTEDQIKTPEPINSDVNIILTKN